MRAAECARHLAQCLAHQSSLQPDMGVAHLTFDFGTGHEGSDRVDDDQIDGARPNQRVRDFECLLTSVRLRHVQIVEVHTQRLRVIRVQRVLGVDEGCEPT